MFKKVLLVVVCSLSVLHAYSYTCFPLMTEKDALAVNPVVFADDKNSGGMETFLYYGLTAKSDLSTSMLTVNGASNFSVMYRHTLGNLSNAGVRVNASWVIPQLNFNWEDDRFIFQSSVASQFTYDYMNAPAMYAVACPGVKISDQLNVCLDINPGYYLQDGDFANCAVRAKGLSLDIAPSVGFTVGNCLFSVALPMYNVTQDASITFGAWIYYSIRGSGVIVVD